MTPGVSLAATATDTKTNIDRMAGRLTGVNHDLWGCARRMWPEASCMSASREIEVG